MEEITKLIDDLQPQAARYDTPIADDLIICTFPNGVRTWIFNYTSNGLTRRRSLGVYPEMSLADARQALFAARKLQAVEDQLAQHGLGSEVIREAPGEGATGAGYALGPRRWLERRTISAAIAGALLSVATLLVGRYIPFDYYFDRFAPVKVRPAGPVGPPVIARAAERPRASRPTATHAAADDASAAAAQHDGTTASVASHADTGPAAAAKPDGASAAPTAELSKTNLALIKAQETLRGSVAREVLARGIEEGRPVQPFATQLTLDADAPTTLYYFTELRGMAGKTVQHRWLHDGKVISEIPMQVGTGWLSALHSSATIAPGMTGHWEVRICDASGRALEQERFELVAATQLSAR